MTRNNPNQLNQILKAKIMKNLATKPSLNAVSIVESIKATIASDGYLEVTIGYDRNSNKDLLELHWIDSESDDYLIIKTEIVVRNISNYENCVEDVDIDNIAITSISVGDGYEQAEIKVPEFFNEHVLGPLLTVIFDASNERLKFKEAAYSVNLLSETPSKRGDNWLLIA